MKLLLILFLVLSLFASGTFCYAETDHRGAFEFCELYAKRFCESELYGTNQELLIHEGLGHHEIEDGLYYVNTSGGTIYVSISDFKVKGWKSIFMDLNASDSANDDYFWSCLVAMSALEFDDTEDAIIGFEYRAKISDEKNAIERTNVLFDKEFYSQLTQNATRLIRNNEMIKIYEGNYTYYLDYYAVKDKVSNREIIFIIAEENNK